MAARERTFMPPPPPDPRDNPGVLLYETQKVVTEKWWGQSPSNSHRLVNTLSTVSAIPEWTRVSAGNRLDRGYRTCDIIEGKVWCCARARVGEERIHRLTR